MDEEQDPEAVVGDSSCHLHVGSKDVFIDLKRNENGVYLKIKERRGKNQGQDTVVIPANNVDELRNLRDALGTALATAEEHAAGGGGGGGRSDRRSDWQSDSSSERRSPSADAAAQRVRAWGRSQGRADGSSSSSSSSSSFAAGKRKRSLDPHSGSPFAASITSSSSSSSPGGTDPKAVYISDLAPDTQWQSVKDALRRAGYLSVSHVEMLPPSSPSSQHRGAIVLFSNAEDGMHAVSELQRMEIGGRAVRLRYANRNDADRMPQHSPAAGSGAASHHHEKVKFTTTIPAGMAQRALHEPERHAQGKKSKRVVASSSGEEGGRVDNDPKDSSSGSGGGSGGGGSFGDVERTQNQAPRRRIEIIGHSGNPAEGESMQYEVRMNNSRKQKKAADEDFWFERGELMEQHQEAVRDYERRTFGTLGRASLQVVAE